MGRNSKTGSAFIIFLIVSCIFLFPLNIGIANAAEPTRQEAAATLCGPFDVRDSLVLSIVSMCLGGVLEKTHQWKEIQCQSIVCHYEAVKYGLDPTFCEKQEEYLTCSYIVGELFAFPPLAVLDYWRNAIAQVIANPVGFLWSVAAKKARAYLAGCKDIACSPKFVYASASFLIVTDIAGVINTLMQMFENGFFGGSEASACERVPEIRREMQEILNLPVDEKEEEGGFLGIF